ncbi:hypothetical protein D3C73_1272910 [compost metagenome]
MLRSVWKPWSDVEVRTWIIAGLPWHIRIHRIAAGRALDAAEGGFALGHEAGCRQALSLTGATAATFWGTSGVKGLLGYQRAELVYPNANTNLLRPRTVLPTLTASLAPGVHWLVSAVYGDPAGEAVAERALPGAGGILEQSPELILNVSIQQNVIKVLSTDGNELIIVMD